MNSVHLRRKPIWAPWLIRLCVTVVLVAGCRETASAPAAEPIALPLTMVVAGHQCGGPSPAPSVQWIDGPDALNTAGSRNDEIEAFVSRSPIDWSRYGLVWIRMGQKPTGGFGLRLASSEALAEHGAAIVKVQWLEPRKGDYVTQMITSPCMLLKLPRSGFKEIAVVDQSGRSRARVKR